MIEATAVAEPLVDAFGGHVWRQFRRHPGGVAGLVVLSVICFAVMLGPSLRGVDPSKISIRERNEGPSLLHPFGTDNLGHDLFAQVLAGGRVSLAVGVAAMALSLVLGASVGVASGYWRRLDGPLMRLTDLFLALPLLPMLLTIRMKMPVEGPKAARRGSRNSVTATSSSGNSGSARNRSVSRISGPSSRRQ